MRVSLKLSTKFLLSFSIMLIGFGIMTFLASGTGKITMRTTAAITKYLIPAARQSELALAAFEEQNRLYEDLLIQGKESQIEEAQVYAERVKTALNQIMHMHELDEQHRQKIQDTLRQLDEFTTAAADIYLKMALPSESEQISASPQQTQLEDLAFGLAETREQIRATLQGLVEEFSTGLQTEMRKIQRSTHELGRGIMALSVIICVIVIALVTIILKRSIIHPLVQIVGIAEQISAGEQEIKWLPDSRDEIGVLNRSLRSMTENLREEITERKKAELSLRQAEKQYRMIFENSLEGIFQFRPDGKLFNANPALARILHYDSPEELLAAVSNFTGQLFAHQDEGDQCQCRLHDEGKVMRFETQLHCKHGDLIWVSISARSVRDPLGKVLYYEGSLMDITERKQAEALQQAYQQQIEQEVQERTRQLSETLEHLKATQQELIQSEKMAALGQLVAGVAHEINTPLGAIRASIGNIDHALHETIRHLPTLLQRLSPAQQEDFLALVNRALQDKQHLTSREERALKRRFIEELERYQLSDVEMIADTLVDMGIYQEIAPFVPLLQRQDADFVLQTAYNLTVQQHNSKNIMTAVERAAKIVFALKSYTHYDRSGEKAMSNITDGLDVVLTLYHNQLKHGIEVIKHYQPIPEIRCYSDELNQVWTNLIQNAIQAMEGKGTLTIDVSQQENYVVVSITDSGCGIPENIRERIFEPFFTTKIAGEGSGLGLDICRKIIDKHQGKIELESQPGNTTFSVFLPIET